jgi:hypothetical protein
MPEGLETIPGGPEIVVRLLPAANVVLTVVDEDGDPVPDATCDIDDCIIWSDDRGRILLTGLDPDERYDIRVSAESPETGVRVIENWRPESATVRLPRRWFIRGAVVDPEGDPIPATRVTWAVPGSRTDLRADEFGEFLIEDLDPGAIRVWASTPHGLRKSERLTVVAGRTDVVIVLDPGVELRVDVADWRSNHGNYTWALIRESGGKWRMTHRFGDEIRFPELDESRRYDVLAGPTEDGRWVLGVGLVPGRRALALVPGVPLRGRVVVPEGANGPWLSVRFDGYDHGIDVNDAHRFAWSAPPRDVTLRATAELEGRILTAEIPASECVDREVVLEPR